MQFSKPAIISSMEENAEKSIKLAGGLEHTATWIKISGEGDLIVDFYDFSAEAHRWFGNDVAYLLTVKSTEKGKILRLLTDGKGTDLIELSEDDAILRLM